MTRCGARTLAPDMEMGQMDAVTSRAPCPSPRRRTCSCCVTARRGRSCVLHVCGSRATSGTGPGLHNRPSTPRSTTRMNRGSSRRCPRCFPKCGRSRSSGFTFTTRDRAKHGAGGRPDGAATRVRMDRRVTNVRGSGPRRPPCAVRAGQHGPPGADGAVGKRDHAPRYRLLHQHPAPTARTGSARGLGGGTDLAQRVQRPLAGDLQREHLPA